MRDENKKDKNKTFINNLKVIFYCIETMQKFNLPVVIPCGHTVEHSVLKKTERADCSKCRKPHHNRFVVNQLIMKLLATSYSLQKLLDDSHEEKIEENLIEQVKNELYLITKDPFDPSVTFTQVSVTEDGITVEKEQLEQLADKDIKFFSENNISIKENIDNLSIPSNFPIQKEIDDRKAQLARLIVFNKVEQIKDIRDAYLFSEPLLFNGETAFHLAAQLSSPTIFQLLLEKNPNFDFSMVDKFGCTPLMIAALNGNINIVKLLCEHISQSKLAKKIKPLINFRSPNTSKTALHFACHALPSETTQQMIDYLLKKGAVHNKKDRDGKTPLLIAAQCGNAPATLALLNAKADTTQVDSQKNNVLHTAAAHDRADVISLLMEQCTINQNIKNKKQQTALDIADQGCYEDSIKALLDPRLPESKTTYDTSHHTERSQAYRESTKKLQLFIKKWHQIDFSNPESRSRCYAKVYHDYGIAVFKDLVSENYLKPIETPKKPDQEKIKLFFTNFFYYLEEIYSLEDLKYFYTILKKYQPDFDCKRIAYLVAYLFRKSIYMESLTSNKRFMSFKYFKKFLKLLVKEESLAILYESFITMNIAEFKGIGLHPLHFAVSIGSMMMVRAAIERDPGIINIRVRAVTKGGTAFRNGETPLHIAAYWDSDNHREILHYLIKKGGDLYAVDEAKHENTPIDIAIQNKCYKNLLILLHPKFQFIDLSNINQNEINEFVESLLKLRERYNHFHSGLEKLDSSLFSKTIKYYNHRVIKMLLKKHNEQLGHQEEKDDFSPDFYAEVLNEIGMPDERYNNKGKKEYIYALFNNRANIEKIDPKRFYKLFFYFLKKIDWQLGVVKKSGLLPCEVMWNQLNDVQKIGLRTELEKNNLLHLVEKCGLSLLHETLQDDEGSPLARFLVLLGADVNLKTNFKEEKPDEDDQSLLDSARPLHIAAYYGNSEIVEFLLKNGADPFLTNSQSVTPLQIAQGRSVSFKEGNKTVSIISQYLEKLSDIKNRDAQIKISECAEKLPKEIQEIRGITEMVTKTKFAHLIFQNDDSTTILQINPSKNGEYKFHDTEMIKSQCNGLKKIILIENNMDFRQLEYVQHYVRQFSCSYEMIHLVNHAGESSDECSRELMITEIYDKNCAALIVRGEHSSMLLHIRSSDEHWTIKEKIQSTCGDLKGAVLFVNDLEKVWNDHLKNLIQSLSCQYQIINVANDQFKLQYSHRYADVVVTHLQSLQYYSWDDICFSFSVKKTTAKDRNPFELFQSPPPSQPPATQQDVVFFYYV